MATNRILSNAKSFVKSLDKTELEINRNTLLGIADWVDSVRSLAVEKYMEPNKFANSTIVRKNKHGDLVAYVRNSNGSLTPHNKLQKPIAGKVTIRTRYLADNIGMKGTWHINNRSTEIRFKGKGPNARHSFHWVRPQSDGYLARLTFGKDDNGSKGPLSYRLAHNKKGRPFIEPAIASIGLKFDSILWRRTSKSVNKVL